MKKTLLLLLAALYALPALAGEAEIRQAMKNKFPNLRVNGVQAAPMAGLFEVRFLTPDGAQILYTDAQANFFIDGSLIEAKSGRNLTEERLQKLVDADCVVGFGSWKKIRRHPDRQGELTAAMSGWTHLAITRVRVPVADIVTLAVDTGLSAYDASYLWLALTRDVELVTLDERLARVNQSLREP